MLLTNADVQEALYQLLRGAFPATVEIYQDLMPANFSRPAIFMEAVEDEIKDVNWNTVDNLCTFSVSYLVGLDEYGNGEENDLAEAGKKLLALVRCGWVRVEDRAVRCTARLKKDVELDVVRMELYTSFWEDRSEPQALPTMGDIQITEKGD